MLFDSDIMCETSLHKIWQICKQIPSVMSFEVFYTLFILRATQNLKKHQQI